jgi:excisionase family DNA binding protein
MVDREYTVDEAAALLGLAPSSVRNAITVGRLTARKIGKRLHVVSAAEIERYRQEHLGKQGWEKRHAPGYKPSPMAAWARGYRARRKATEATTTVDGGGNSTNGQPTNKARNVEGEHA